MDIETVTLTFDPRSSISIGFEPMNAISNHLAKIASKSVHPFGWNFVHKKRAGHTDTQTHIQTNCSENILNPSKISWRCKYHSNTRFKTKMIRM